MQSSASLNKGKLGFPNDELSSIEIILSLMQKEIERAISTLEKGGTLIYPTDTIWGIGCDATQALAVDKVYKIKNRSESKSLIILVDSIEMLSKYVDGIPDKIVEFVTSSDRPTTVIYNNPSGLADNVIAADNTIAIRIAKDAFCQTLIAAFGKPIVSTSANISDQPSPAGFDEIDSLLLKKADYIVNLPAIETKNKASQIIKLNDLGEIEFLRK